MKRSASRSTSAAFVSATIFSTKMEPLAQRAFASMHALEAGEIANPDENRMVGHYWLRAPKLAPTPELKAEIEECNKAISDFVRSDSRGRKVHGCASDRHRRIGTRPAIRERCSGLGGATGCGCTFSTTPTRREWIECLARSSTSWNTRSPSSSRNREAPPRRGTECSKQRPPTKRRGWNLEGTRSPSRALGRRLIKWPSRADGSRVSPCGIGWVAAPR